MKDVQSDWYASAFQPEMADMTWAEHTGREVDRALKMLKPRGDERILDMACGNGRHALEFRRRGFEVVGVELSEPLIEVARADAEAEGLDVTYLVADLRELEFEDEFDLVLNLNDGAIGYLETEEDNERIFERASRALRADGRQLMQLPNVLRAEKHSPQRTWLGGEGSIEILEHEFNKGDRCLYGAMHLIREGDTFNFGDRIEFRQRLYTADEMDTLVRKYGMRLSNVFRGNGRARQPDDTQYEVFYEATKD
ncbi:MAG TPA: class I SAM-dependent methyltransferase [Solirubrobacterales bacterium]|nr:class I SAM-dependent methyltransferase [Solirubrobacterales bacterium]